MRFARVSLRKFIRIADLSRIPGDEVHVSGGLRLLLLGRVSPVYHQEVKVELSVIDGSIGNYAV